MPCTKVIAPDTSFVALSLHLTESLVQDESNTLKCTAEIEVTTIEKVTFNLPKRIKTYVEMYLFQCNEYMILKIVKVFGYFWIPSWIHHESITNSAWNISVQLINNDVSRQLEADFVHIALDQNRQSIDQIYRPIAGNIA